MSLCKFICNCEDMRKIGIQDSEIQERPRILESHKQLCLSDLQYSCDLYLKYLLQYLLNEGRIGEA